ncbi:hypothetical protein HCU64_22740 [Methylobacterium sp. C25]|nr:hypothetical protein [Methylobacterium sp. C25]
MTKFSLALAGVVAFASPVMAQSTLPLGHPPIGSNSPSTTGANIGGQNNTGGEVDVTVPRGSTGADTFQSDSAAAGNANQPERAVPQGSGGGGGNSN